ncbi:UvrD-helicase domain-containing protein [Mycoplasma struthionis]|uniref:UvrD-helicase domain-containing protein n=1 Tax=Mycoplasma struthionis TaxID=538220 RepID=UPI0021BDB828|nr:ATP-dependent helicase [Mycoplasma struthionis]
MIDLNLLNEQQKSAVIYNEGPLRIIAGAGSGKTRVLTYKIAYLMENLNVEGHQILALTFSNKAANEMKQRVYSIIETEDPNYLPTISTFHAMCAKILRREIHHLGYSNDFQILDELDQKENFKINLFTTRNFTFRIHLFINFIFYSKSKKSALCFEWWRVCWISKRK